MEPQPATLIPEQYDFQAIEAHWQRVWEERGTFLAPDDDPRQKLYVLQMFPYPSGELHAGHIRNYVLGDAVARYWRMRGYNVLHPMGFDSFGLPAEQAAIDRNVQPSDWIATCVNNSRRQFRRYGFSFDWSREVVTSEPEYYRWTQWLFVKLYEMGLVYRKEVEVNWCEEHGVLANDEVKDGGCWRCDQPVVKKRLAQWLMRTTDYAQRLLDGLELLPGWNEAVRTMQRNWIGRSEGTNIDFAVPAVDGKLTVFTTRVDTIFGCTFMAIAPGHPLAQAIAAAGGTTAELARFSSECAREAVEYAVAEEKPKRGLRLGVDCINPFNGEAIPIFATNYVISDFGTGAVMAVPAHDTRDYAFALEYELPIRQVIVPSSAGDESIRSVIDYVRRCFNLQIGERTAERIKTSTEGAAPQSENLTVDVRGVDQDTGLPRVVEITTKDIREAMTAGDGRPPVPPGDLSVAATQDVPPCFTEKGVCVNSGQFDGLDFAAAKAAMDDWLAGRGQGGAAVEYRLRDWNMSRQRFWGAPIPMVHCQACAAFETDRGRMAGWHPVPAKELPVVLPEIADYSDVRVSPLANDEHWQHAACPKCGGPARRETDTMTTFMDSAWYFLRFCDPQNEHRAFDPELAAGWMPVDVYIGGKEHAVGHLLYSRFVVQALRQAGILELRRPDAIGELPLLVDEPFRRLYNQGIVYKGGAKMSKSKGNVVSADELADTYGADTARLFSFFGGPYDQDLEWTTAGVEGCHRFLKRLWRFARQVQAKPGSADYCDDACVAAVRVRHKAVAGVTADITGWRFNTAIAKLMECLNELEAHWQRDQDGDNADAFRLALLTMAKLLCPFAPHIAEELWFQLGGLGLCSESEWPIHDPSMLIEETVELPVQVNGKLRGKIIVAREAEAGVVLEAAKADAQVAKWLAGKELVKEIVVPGRMVTFVVK